MYPLLLYAKHIGINYFLKHVKVTTNIKFLFIIWCTLFLVVVGSSFKADENGKMQRIMTNCHVCSVMKFIQMTIKSILDQHLFSVF